MQNIKINTCGLSCPQPVLMAIQAMKNATTESIEITVDNEASRENVLRAVASKGWSAQIQQLNENEYVLVCKKS